MTADVQTPERRTRRRRAVSVKTMWPHENVFFDSMMVNLAAGGADPHVEALLECPHVQCLLPYSVHREASRPTVPAEVRSATARFLHTIDVGPLTAPEREDVEQFFVAHLREALPKNIVADLFHVWESAKYGGRFFVTHDHRLATRADAIHEHKSIWIVTAEEATKLMRAMLETNSLTRGDIDH